MEEELLTAIRELNLTIARLSASLGRGIPAGATGGRAGGVGRGAERATESVVDRFKNQISQVHKALAQGSPVIGIFKRRIDESADAVDDYTKAVRKSADTEEETAKIKSRATKDLAKGLRGFGIELLTGSDSIERAFGSLSSATSWAAHTGNKFAQVLNTLALAGGFTFGQMTKFGETAQEISGMVDLSVLKIASAAAAKRFSSLDKYFSTVVNESAGSFRVFGETSQEAIENLSQLSRGLRLGSGYVKSSMQKTLGKDVVKDFDRASDATAALGLTQQEQAKLQAAIMQTVRLGAKNEVDAQKMLVKQYADTVESVRKFSNQMGVSAKDVADSIAKFLKSPAGQLAAMKGVAGANEVFMMLKEFMPSLSEDVIAGLATDIARGQGQAALASIDQAYQPVGQALLGAIEQARAMPGGITGENLNRSIKANTENIRAITKQFTGEAGAGAQAGALPVSMFGQYVRPAIDVETALTRANESTEARAKREEEQRKKIGKTEANNLQTMDRLTGALDSLRTAIIELNGSILGMAPGIGGTLLHFFGGMLFFGALKSVFGRIFLGSAAGGSIARGMGSVLKSALGLGGAGAAARGMTTAGDYLASLGKAGASQGFFSSIGSAISGAFKEGGIISSIGSAIVGAFKEGGIARSFLGLLKNMIGFGGPSALSTGGIVAGTAGSGLLASALAIGSKLVKGLGAGGLIYGAGELGADVIGKDTTAGALTSLLGSTAGGAVTGLTLGGPLGAAIGGLAGLGAGLWSNASTLFGSRTPDITSGVDQTGSAKVTRADTPSDRPEMYKIMNYLATISNDIAAIRSNTRGDNASVPVRLG